MSKAGLSCGFSTRPEVVALQASRMQRPGVAEHKSVLWVSSWLCHSLRGTDPTRAGMLPQHLAVMSEESTPRGCCFPR